MFLAFVTHDVNNNTLEAVWMDSVLDADGNLIKYENVKNRNYSPDQKSEFIADCGDGSDKYTTMAGW